MENEETTVDFQDEIQEEETFEVDETEDSEESKEESSDNDENSTQNQEDELKKAQAEIAKLNRLLKKESKSKEEDSKPSPSNDSNVVTKEDLERLRLEAKGYEEDDVDLIMKFGGVKALEDEAIKDVIEVRREKRQQESAQATSKTQSKGTRRYSQEQLRDMPLEKLETLIKEGKIK